IWKQFFDVLNALHIGSRRDKIFIIASFVSAYKNMIVPQHYITPFNMYFIRWTNHFIGIHLIDYILNRIQFTFTIRQNIGFYKKIVNYKTNIATKYLIVIFDYFRAIYFYIIFFKNIVKSFHFFHHIGFCWISTRFNML